MPVLKIADLTAHPKNEYFFDDIQGDGWNDLLQCECIIARKEVIWQIKK